MFSYLIWFWPCRLLPLLLCLRAEPGEARPEETLSHEPLFVVLDERVLAQEVAEAGRRRRTENEGCEVQEDVQGFRGGFDM